MTKPTPDPMIQTTLDTRAEQYIKIRDALKAKKEEHAKIERQFTEAMDLLQGYFQAVLDKLGTGVTSIKTKCGTVTASTRYTASLEDADSFMRHVIATESWDLLDRRANATAVRAFVEANGQLPPGAKLSALRTIGVTRPRGSGAAKEEAE